MHTKKRILQPIVLGVVFTFIPTTLSYLASSDYVFEILIKKNIIGHAVNISLTQEICLFLSILFTALLVCILYPRAIITGEHAIAQRNALISMNKDMLAAAISTELKQNVNFDIRIFTPYHYRLHEILKKIHINKPLYFKIKNIELIARDDITSKLQFEVFPKSEGLVGICYKEKALVYDDNLRNTNDKKYNLSSIQLDRTSKLEWSICCPIKDKYSRIVAILAIDGNEKIHIEDENEPIINKQVIAFSRMLYDKVPEIFK